MYPVVRRVKCDEATPFCYCCTSTGRKCDGYAQNVEKSSESARKSSGALICSPSIGSGGTADERRSFFFFQQNTAPQLSGFFGGNFWETLLLQSALHDASIRHAIIALGSLHANFESHDGAITQSPTSGWNDDFALRNYSQAISKLVGPLSREGRRAIDVCLICSILFACLEVSRFHVHAQYWLMGSRQCKVAMAPLLHMSKAE